MKMPASTCSFDGKCDGAGGCRKYPENTQCKSGTCDGDAVVGSSVCDGSGHCKPGSTRICVPYTCNMGSGACFGSCTSNSQCVSGQACVQGSCGKLMIGATCETGDQCASGFCADKVCCNVACKGACLSCNLMGREGRCWPLDTDAPDSRGVCRDQGPHSCGQTGFCDGIGGCSKYPRDTVCVTPTCSGVAKVNTAGTCNGLGTCQAPGIQDCHPFRCATGACTKTCATNADCDTGIACVNNTCGLKQDGQSCTADAECQHSHCVDGVCCDQACTGSCRSCSLAATMGRCTPIALGSTDPRGMCKVMPQSSCSHQRQVRRQRRLSELAGRHAVRRRDLHRQRLQGPVDVQRERPVRGAGSDPVQPLRLQWFALLQRLQHQRAVPDAEQLRGELVRQERPWRDVLGARRVQEQLLRARRLLRPGLHRRVQIVRRRHAG